MEQDDARCTRGRGFAEHFPGVHDAAVERAHRQHGGADEAVLRVEEHDAELFNRARAELRQQVHRDLAGREELRAVGRLPDERAPAEFDGRQHLRRLGFADARDPPQFAAGAGRQPVNAAGGVEHEVGEREGACTPRSGAEHQRDQFVVAECRHAKPAQLLPGPVPRRRRLHKRDSSAGLRAKASGVSEGDRARARQSPLPSIAGQDVVPAGLVLVRACKKRARQYRARLAGGHIRLFAGVPRISPRRLGRRRRARRRRPSRAARGPLRLLHTPPASQSTETPKAPVKTAAG